MAHGRSDSLSDQSLLTDIELGKVIKSLTKNLVDIEDEMIVAWQSGKSKVNSNLSKNYLKSINDLTEQLRNISSTIFNETKISEVKPYKPSDVVPLTYSNYLNASNNTARLVTQDVLYQSDADHAIAAFDRWLYVCKNAFEQHDFFTAFGVISGLNDFNIGKTKVESKLSYQSKILFKYYSSIFFQSSVLYYRQATLSREKLEIIPALQSLANHYESLDYMTPKNARRNISEIAELAVRRRAASRSFRLIQKKDSSQSRLEGTNLVPSLYRIADDKFVDHFAIRSDILKKNVEMQKNDKFFSLADFADLSDLRIKLIMIQANIEKTEDNYPKEIASLLADVRRILCDLKLTDKEVRHKISDKFELTSLQLGKKLRKQFKGINSILCKLIIKENENPRKINAEELKMTSENAETKSRSHKHKHKIKEIGSSSAGFEEESLPKENVFKTKTKKRHLQKSGRHLSEAENDESSPALIERKLSVPSLGSSLKILNELKVETPRSEVTKSSSVRSELDGLKSARSARESLKAYRESVAKSGGLVDALISIRHTRERVEDTPSEHVALSATSSGMGIKGSKQ